MFADANVLLFNRYTKEETSRPVTGGDAKKSKKKNINKLITPVFFNFFCKGTTFLRYLSFA